MPTSVVNFEGLSAEAAEKLSGSLATAVHAKITDMGVLLKDFDRLPPEAQIRLKDVLHRLAEGGGGGCGIGCC